MLCIGLRAVLSWLDCLSELESGDAIINLSYQDLEVPEKGTLCANFVVLPLTYFTALCKLKNRVEE